MASRSVNAVRTGACTTIIMAALALVVIGCTEDHQTDDSTHADLVQDVKGFDEIIWHGEVRQDRIWIENRLSELYTLEGPEDSLYVPGRVVMGGNDDLFVVDYGEFKIKRYDSFGVYLRSYGRGLGPGPDQFESIVDVEVLGDTALAVLDGVRRSITYFELGNNKYDVVKYDLGVSRMAHSDGAVYFTSFTNGNYIVRCERNKPESCVDLISGSGISNREAYYNQNIIVTTSSGDLLVSLAFKPLLIRIDSMGGILYSRRTIRNEDYREPTMRLSASGSGQPERLAAQLIQNNINYEDGRLYIGGRQDSTRNSSTVDIYDAGEGLYIGSIPLPRYSSSTYASSSHIVLSDGTRVTVYGH